MKLTGFPQGGSIRTLLARTALTQKEETEFSLQLGRQENSQQGVKTPTPLTKGELFFVTSSDSPAERKLICLGAITPKTPTVSHLLVRNPDYRKRCWELIHAAQNKDKSYKDIPSGKSIYFDPATEEILWDVVDTTRKATVASDSYRSVSEIKADNSAPTNDALKGKIVEPITAEATARATQTSGSKKAWTIPDQPQSLGKVLVEKVRHYIGTPYRRLDCFELVVEGLKKMGIQYGGKDGLRQYLIGRARQDRLPLNSYLTGDGLIEASGNSIYAKSFAGLRQPARKTEEIWNDIEPLLEPGLMISFSAGRRGHTGIISRHEEGWTFINSGIMDNDIHSSTRRKRVGEEDLKEEISNWLQLAYVRRKPLRINLGRLEKNKVAAYRNEADRAECSTEL